MVPYTCSLASPAKRMNGLKTLLEPETSKKKEEQFCRVKGGKISVFRSSMDSHNNGNDTLMIRHNFPPFRFSSYF